MRRQWRHAITKTLKERGPRWLARANDIRFFFSIGAVLDALHEWSTQGVLARFPLTGPADALPFIGKDRGLQAGPAEPSDSFRIRLLQWLDAWRLAGHAYAVLDQVAAYLSPHQLQLRIVTNSGMWYSRAADGTLSWQRVEPNSWDWDNAPSKWWRFWLIIYPPPELWVSEKWGDAGLWGDDVTSFAGTATVQQCLDLRTIVRKWKPAHAECPYMIISYDAAKFDPSSSPTMPDGTWGPWSKGDPRVPARDPECEYWPG